MVGATLRDIHRHSVDLISELIARLGIVDASTAREVSLQGLYRPYYPHSIGHWLGLDTHDCHGVSSSQRLEEGVVLTIEPGLYLPQHLHTIPKHYRGIGIRLEDDVVCHSYGPEVLTSKIPIFPDQLEQIVGNGGGPAGDHERQGKQG